MKTKKDWQFSNLFILVLAFVVCLVLVAAEIWGTHPVEAASEIQSPPPYANASTDQWAERREYDGSNRITYVGQCMAKYQQRGGDEVWRIKKYTYDGVTTNILSITWADNVDTFSKAWNSRTTYSY